MKLIFVILIISVIYGIEGTGRGRKRYRGRQLPLDGQPDTTEKAWDEVDLLKVKRKQDVSHSLPAESLVDTVVVGKEEYPASRNSTRQYLASWSPDAVDEVPHPIDPSPYPPQYLLSQPPLPQQPPYQPQPPQQSSQHPSYQPQVPQQLQQPQSLKPPQQPEELQPSQQPPYHPRPPTQPPLQPQPQLTSPAGCLNPRGQFPSQNSCANYLNCWDDVVIEQQCPNSLLFNDITELCDFKYNVNCGSRPEATPKPPLAAGSMRCPDPSGRYRSATNCSVFYVCLAGNPIEFSCPRGLVYNDDYGVCDYIYNVDCRGAMIPTPDSLPHSELPQQPQQPQLPQQPQRPDPTFPPSAYPENPWLVRDSQPDAWHQSASSEAEVDIKEQVWNSQTGVSVEPDATTIPTIQHPWDLMHKVPAEFEKVPCINGLVHRLNDSCSIVVVCQDERPKLVQCPEGQTYDTPSDSCLHFSIAKC